MDHKVFFDALESNDPMLMALYTRGKNFNVNTVIGHFAAIHVAVKEKNAIGLTILLEHNDILIDLKDFSIGWTALHHAAHIGSLEMVEQLLCYGANPNMPDHFMNTPLHVAAENRDNGIIDLLLRFGADLNAVNNRGQTPSQAAIFRRQYGNVGLLSKE